MKVWRKFTAVAFALVMMLAISAVASAEPAVPVTIPDGTADGTTNGVFADPSKVNPTAARQVNIAKDIKVYNANSTSVSTPTFGYTYTVAPAIITSYTVTDSDNIAVNVEPGITTGLVVNTGDAGNAISATGTISFESASNTFVASSSGASNPYTITLDFAGVTFEHYGIYRYSITEALTNGGYSDFGLVDGSANVVYLDVYANGSGAIYGYVCSTANDSINTSTATKTTGFVGTLADSYYTYDLDVSKTVANDNYGQTLAFPFTVTFNPATGMTGSNFKITETAASGSTGIGTDNAVNAGSTGVAQVKHGATIAYTGIPCGVNVTIYETNNNVGVTYSAVTTVNTTAYNAEQIIATTTSAVPTYAAQSGSKGDYETTARTIETTVGTAVAAKQTFNINNTLVLISPTGVTLRYAPYLAMMGVGIVALPLSIRRKKEDF